jgi:hypothetical protein
MNEHKNWHNNEALSKAETLNLDAVGTETEVSLNLYSVSIDIEMLSKVLCCRPTKTQRIGDKVKPHSPPAKIGRWALDAPNEMTLPNKLRFLLKATTSDQAVWDKLSLTHDIQVRCAIFLHSWTDGFDISSEVISDIGKRHWLFGISVYSAEGNEILNAFLKKPSTL